MNIPGHIEVDDSMLAKYLSGEASPEEAVAVDQWVSASRGNRVLLKQAMTIWAQIPENISWQLPEKEKWLRDFRRKLSRRPPRPLNRFRWMAAALIPILIVGTILWLIHPGGNSKEISSWVTRSGGPAALPDTLPDQSVVALGHYATIRYPVHFTGSSREVLLRGGASFIVAPDPEKPFIVDVEGLKIKVLGTSFEVRPDTAAISVEVQSGIVSMFRGDSGITVTASHTGVYDRKNGQFSVINNLEAVVRSLNFRNASLKQIADKLEKAYGIRVIFENKRLESCTMSTKFDRKPLSFVLNVISITLNIHYRIDKTTVYLSGAGCN